MDSFKVIAFTHKNLPLELIGKLHLNEEQQKSCLGALKLNYNFTELLFLNTCNRVELFFVTDVEITNTLTKEILIFLNSRLNNAELEELITNMETYTGEQAITHVFSVAASIDSLVVGEREIITQVRKAYDVCNLIGLTGDFMRLLTKQTIETAKQIYTDTDIAKNPVSIVSLAYRSLRAFGIKNNARFVFVGSGETNTLMATYLKKHQYANFSVFNRTLLNAKKLANVLNGKAFELSELQNYKAGFDVLIVCTASTSPVINSTIYKNLLHGDTNKKIIIDLGLPANVDEEVIANNLVHYIDINSLKEQAETNMQLRKKEVEKCYHIIQNKTEEFKWLHKERRIELAFGEIPKQVKAIKEFAVNEVFTKEISTLDNTSKEVLEKVLAYVEKKYNAVAIKTAKDVLLNQKD